MVTLAKQSVYSEVKFVAIKTNNSKKKRFIVGYAENIFYFCAANIINNPLLSKFWPVFFLEKMNAIDIIYHFYPTDTPLRRLLLLHSQCVADKALSILDNYNRYFESHPEKKSQQISVDRKLVYDGAMLHDIGICRCDAKGILCEGAEPYICHGTIGAQMLRNYIAELEESEKNFLEVNVEVCARICERHTGAGLTRQNILDQQLPISPACDLLPETPEEKLVCLADKFFSKSGDSSQEKTFDRVRKSMQKFGEDSVCRFEELCSFFYYNTSKW